MRSFARPPAGDVVDSPMRKSANAGSFDLVASMDAPAAKDPVGFESLMLQRSRR